MSNLTKQAVKKTGRARKETIVAQLTEKIDSTNGLVFTDYKGISHINLETLKRNLKKQDSTMVIAKNSLLRISLGKSQKYADFKDNEGLDLPTATLLIKGDMVEPLRTLQKAIKESGLPKIKFGILEGQLLDENGVLKIASLPNRETLLAQFVGTLNSPIQGLVVTLNGTIQKFVMTLDAIARLPRPEPSDGGQAKSATVPSAVDAQSPTTQPSAQEVTKPDIEIAVRTSADDSSASEPTDEIAVSANEPAVQNEAPVETDELADVGTETEKSNEETEKQTKGGEKTN